jgi:hypothetical protein
MASAADTLSSPSPQPRICRSGRRPRAAADDTSHSLAGNEILDSAAPMMPAGG